MAIKIAGTTVIDDSRNITTDVGTVDGVDIAQLKIDFDNSTGLVDLVDDTTPQLGGELDTNGNDIYLPDDDKIKLGNGADLQIYHDSSTNKSHITESGASHLVIQGQEIQFKNASGVALMDLNSAQVELRYSGTKKMETNNEGITVTGDIALSGTVDGRDVDADGTKLDGIETGATADQTKADIDALNVDADTLDGSHASAFATAAQGTTADAALPKAGGTITGDLTVNDTLTIGSNNVGTETDIAFTAQAAVVGENNMSFGLTNNTDGYYRWMFGNTSNTGGTAGATQKMRLDKDGNLTLSGTVDGRDIDADGTKLDTIETNATADQTKADIDALNVDADTLDGQHGSYYTGYADTAVANLVASAPGTLDTLNELAAALGDDPNFATTMTTALAGKVDDSQVLTNVPAGALFTDTNTQRAIHDTPVNGATTTSISSNWAFDNVKTAVPSGAVFTDNNTTYSVGDNGLTQKNFTSTLKTKLDGIATSATNTAVPAIASNGTTPLLASGITAAEVRSLIGAGTSSSDNATHTGDVTGSTALSIGNNKVTPYHLNVTGNGSSTQFLRSDGDGSFTWAVPTDTNTTYSVGDGGLTQKNFTTTLKTKLDGIATGANNYSFPYTVATAAGNSTIVQRDGNGYVFAHYYNGTGTFSTSGGTSGMGLFTGTNGTDTYGRSYTAAAARTLLNVANGATNVTNTNQLTNGAGFITSYVNTTYSAGGSYGMTLSGTEFRLENDRRRNATNEDIWSGNTHDYTFYDNDVGIRWYTANAEEMRLEDGGDLHVDGNVVAYSTTTSDERLKKDIVKIDNALDKVSQLNGYTFEYLNDGKKSAGILAQEVEAVMPSAVSEMKLPLQSDDDQEYKVVQYDQLHGLLIEAIKELKAEIEVLKGK